MARRRKGSRVYWKRGRAYGDFRSFASVGGDQEALIPPGDSVATTDPDVADALAAARVKVLEASMADRQQTRRRVVILGREESPSLANFVAFHLAQKAELEEVTDEWMEQNETFLKAFIAFLDELAGEHGGPGADVSLGEIRVGTIKDFRLWLKRRPNGRGGRIAPGTQRHYLNAVGNLFATAIEEEVYPYANPVHSLKSKPQSVQGEAAFLEVWEGALFLEGARTFPYHVPSVTLAGRLQVSVRSRFGDSRTAIADFARELAARGKLGAIDRVSAYVAGGRIPEGPWVTTAADVLGVEPEWLRGGWQLPQRARPHPILYPVVATMLLTGGRQSEVYGLELTDISFRRGMVTFRENQWRGLKSRRTRTWRDVPLFPQLAGILEEYVDGLRRELLREAGAGTARLLFPSPRLLGDDGTEGPLVDIRKGLDAVGSRIGWAGGRLRTKLFRHTWCAARLRTVVRGFPIDKDQVMREMGHLSQGLVNKIYGHLGSIPHRGEHVEYRLEHFDDLRELADGLKRLRLA